MAELKHGRDYRVIGHLWGAEPNSPSETFERLRFVGTMLGSFETTKVEVFFLSKSKHHVLFKPGKFEAEELST